MYAMLMTICVMATMMLSNGQSEPYILNVKYDTKVYLLFYKTFATSTEANDICSKQGGSLVNIYGAEVHRQIFASMKSLIGTHFFQNNNVLFNDTWLYWISQYTPRLNMNYVNPKFEQFTNWYIDVLGPTIGSDYNGGANSYGCPNVLLGTDSGYWGVAPCNRKIPFVCEIPKEDGKIETDNAMYSIYIQSYTRNQAQALCNSTGGHLPYIKSADENILLSNTVREYIVGTKSGSYGSNVITNGFWIGVINATADYKQWAYDDGSNASYTNWTNGFFDNIALSIQYSLPMQYYVYCGIDGNWGVTYYHQSNFVCQYEKTNVQVNLTRIEQWANIHNIYNTTSNIIINQVNSTQHISAYNISIVTNSHILNDTFYNSTTINNNIDNVLNTTHISYNSTSISNNTTHVYDRKIITGHDKSQEIFWTLVGIGGFIVIATCILICICASCWCYYR